jgi:hypothetical protein
MAVADTLELLDWKRRVFGLYAAVRAMSPEAGWELWRETRDELFGSHPQSPLPEDRRASFERLEYWPYDPQARVLAELEDVEAPPQPVTTSGTDPILFRPFARASFVLSGSQRTAAAPSSASATRRADGRATAAVVTSSTR